MIGNRIVSEKRLCDEFGNLIPDENEESQKGGFQEEAWSNNHKKIWSKLPRNPGYLSEGRRQQALSM